MSTISYAGLLRVLQRRIERVGLRALAREFKCSPAYLCDVRYMRRLPGPKIQVGLGYAPAGNRYRKVS